MSEHSGQGTDGEGDFFDRWLAQRDVEEHPGDQPRSSTVPPKWAPKVVAPPPDPVAPPEPEEPPLAREEPPPPPVAPPYVPAAAHVATPVAAPTVAPAAVAPGAVAPGAIAASTAPAPTMAPPPPPPPPSAPPPPPPPPAPVYDSVADLAPTSVLSRVPEPREPAPRHAEPLPGPPARPSGRTTTEAAPKTKAEKTEDTPPPIRHTFAPRTRARMAVGIGTLLAAIASVIGCYIAAREKDLPSIGIAVTLWVLTGIIWAVHSGTSVTRLSVRGGQLQVIRHGVRTTIDLTSSYTPVEVYGRPGKHGWKVIFRRRDMSAFVIDQSMVDPAEFMRVLRYYRPGVDAETK